MHRSIRRAAVAAVVVVLSAGLVPVAAQAHNGHRHPDYNHLWRDPVVCVETEGRVDRSWGVRRVARYWTVNTPAQFYVRAECGSRHRVTIRQVDRPRVRWRGREASWIYERTHFKARSVVWLNVGNSKRWHWPEGVHWRCARKSVAAHELGHTLGLAHQLDVGRSIMSYSKRMMTYCGEPHRYDHRLVRRAY